MSDYNGAEFSMNCRKGQAEWAEVVTLIFVAVAILMIALALPAMIDNITSLFALGSSEAVARDLAGLVTVSGAALEKATITYAGADSTIVYKVDIANKVVTVDAFRVTESGAGVRTLERVGGSTALGHGVSRIPFNIAAAIDDSNTFTITKSLFGDGSNYDIRVTE